ncbi:low temperature requirement protein A, partial [Salmonella enterica subsp. enterica serovar Istanbul]|nr:low temperature requirement protein A [Salmonella enterica subsp. enterica serovar Istanbul]
ILSTIGGPLVFLVGTILFKLAIRGFLQLSHIVGIVLLLALWWFAADLSPLQLSAATTAILIVVAVWESVSLGSSPKEAEA